MAAKALMLVFLPPNLQSYERLPGKFRNTPPQAAGHFPDTFTRKAPAKALKRSLGAQDFCRGSFPCRPPSGGGLVSIQRPEPYPQNVIPHLTNDRFKLRIWKVPIYILFIYFSFFIYIIVIKINI